MPSIFKNGKVETFKFELKSNLSSSVTRNHLEKLEVTQFCITKDSRVYFNDPDIFNLFPLTPNKPKGVDKLSKGELKERTIHVCRPRVPLDCICDKCGKKSCDLFGDLSWRECKSCHQESKKNAHTYAF